MKKRSMTLAALGLLLALGLTLTGCDNISAIMGGGKIDATAYMQGQLDEIYLGKFDPDYLKMVDATEAAAQETYDGGMEAEVEAFNYYFGVEYPTDEYKTRMLDLYKQAYSKADYTVVSSAEQDDGSYSVKITVRPLDIIQLMNANYGAFSEEFEAKYADVDVAGMSDEEYATWNETVYDIDYQNGLADLFELLLPEMGYMEEKSIAVQIEKGEDDYYSLNSDDFDNLDLLIIDYTSNT